MAGDVAEIETRPVEPKRNEKPHLVPARESEVQSERNDGKSNDGKPQESDRSSEPLPRWPFVLAGLVVALFVAVVLYTIFRP